MGQFQMFTCFSELFLYEITIKEVILCMLYLNKLYKDIEIQSKMKMITRYYIRIFTLSKIL